MTRGDVMAFVRRKGNAFYLVHNVRRGGKVRQLHLAKLGERARITEEVVREVSKKHPFVELNWRALREHTNQQVDLADASSPAIQKLVASLRALNLELADLFPPLLRISESPAVARELLVQLRLLQSTLQVKLTQFDRKRGRFGNATLRMQGRSEETMSAQILPLDPNLRSNTTIEFQTALRSKIVGQAEGVQALVDLYQVFCAGLNSPGRPVGNLLLLGPTGSGKTRIVEAAAEILFGDARAVIKVDCAEFQHSHEIAKLIGSPPGYLGHRKTHPLITQEDLAKRHTDKLKLSFLLFDEIEKASDALWQLLLGMLDKATLTLGDNRRVDLSQTVIFLTSNLGGGEITELMHGGMGFVQPTDKPATGLDEKVERTAMEAARRKFSPRSEERLD